MRTGFTAGRLGVCGPAVRAAERAEGQAGPPKQTIGVSEGVFGPTLKRQTAPRMARARWRMVWGVWCAYKFFILSARLGFDTDPGCSSFYRPCFWLRRGGPGGEEKGGPRGVRAYQLKKRDLAPAEPVAFPRTAAVQSALGGQSPPFNRPKCASIRTLITPLIAPSLSRQNWTAARACPNAEYARSPRPTPGPRDYSSSPKVSKSSRGFARRTAGDGCCCRLPFGFDGRPLRLIMRNAPGPGRWRGFGRFGPSIDLTGGRRDRL